MADDISPEDRELIDRAIAAGKVRKIPAGKSAFEIVENPETGRLVWVNTERMEASGQADFGFGRRFRADRKAVAARRARVRDAHARGLTTAAIAHELTVNKKTVEHDLAAMNLPANQPKRVQRADPQALAERRRQIREMADRGVSQVMIARKLGVSETTVSCDLAAIRAEAG